MPGSEVHNKTIKVNGFRILQILFESVGMCQALHCWQNMEGPTISRPRAELNFSMHNLFHCVLLRVKELLNHIAARNQLNCRGSRPHSRMIHQK